MLGLANIEIPSNVQGQDLALQMLGERNVPERPTFCEVDTSFAPAYGPCTSHRAMIRCEPWKLSYSLHDAGYGEDGALYNLNDDPGELHNFFSSTDHKAIITDLKNQIAAWQEAKDGCQ